MNRKPQPQAAPAPAKKTYETPRLLVHGRVDEITKSVFLALSHH